MLSKSYQQILNLLISIQPGWHWWWAVDNFAVYSDTTAVSIEDKTSNIPREFYLFQNYPNPFNPTTIIKFTISDRPAGRQGLRFTILKIYDVLGNEVATLVNEEKDAGDYEIEFNATDITSGICFYRFTAVDGCHRP